MFGRRFWGDAYYGPRYWGRGGAVAPPTPPPQVGQTPAGKSKRRYFVHIDGHDFEVRSPEQARQVLQRAVALAEVAAEKNVQPKVLEGKVAPVRPVVPEIRTNAPIDIEPYQRAIEAAYRNIAVIAELRALLEAQENEEDEWASTMLLL